VGHKQRVGGHGNKCHGASQDMGICSMGISPTRKMQGRARDNMGINIDGRLNA
jgi:hypothetical protein